MSSTTPSVSNGRLFMMGVLVLCGLLAIGLALAKSVRGNLDGLDAVAGSVTERESINRGRTGGRELRVVLRTGDGPLELRQDFVGNYAYRFNPGDSVRAWVEPAQAGATAREVWQIERGGKVLLSVAEVQHERDIWRYLMLGTGIVILLTGLYYLGRGLIERGLIEIAD